MNDSEKTKEQLVKELELFRTLIDTLPDRIFVKDTQGRFIICNKAVVDGAEIHPPDGVIGKSDFDLYPPERARQYYQREQQIIKTGEPMLNEEIHGIDASTGKPWWSLSTKIPWRNEAGEILGLIGANRDITDWKNIEEALAESEARYKAIFETIREGILIVDIETRRFKYVNPAICKMFGYTSDEFTGLTVSDIHPKEQLDWILVDIEVNIRGEKMASRNIPCLRKDKTAFYADINTANVIIDQRRCGVGCFTDVTQHKSDEEALRESEARYKAIFESAREGIVVTDAETKRFMYVNPAMCRMFGYNEQDFVRMSIKDIHLQEYAPEAISHFEAMTRGQRELSRNVPCLRSDGTIFYADISTAIVSIDNRLCNIGFFSDITQNKLAEEALRENEQKYRLLVEQLPAITYTAALDEQSTTLYTSPQVEQIMGVKPDDYKANPGLWRKMLHPDDRGRVLEELDRAHSTGCNFSCEYRITAKDGYVVWIRDDARIIKDAQGNPLYLQGVMYDITERKRIEEELQRAQADLEARVQNRTADLADAVNELQKEIAERRRIEMSLRQAEEQFRTIFENAIVGIYRTTPDGRILMANPAFIKMLGYNSFEELTKVNLEKEGFALSTPRSAFKQLMETKGAVSGLETLWLRRDGTRLYVSENSFAARDAAGKIQYYEGTVQDITQRKEAEQKLMIYQQQLRTLASEISLAEERLRRKIAADLHDNIGQNLAISKMKLDSLAPNARPDQAEPLKEATDLIARTIEMSRTLTFEMSPPVLYELGLEAAIGWLVNQTRQRFGVETDFLDDGKPKPLGDDVKVLLFAAVRELLTNVVKHAKARKIKVTTQAQKKNICITVEDNGVGFDAARTSSGFGLFNVRERLDYIDGKVRISSGSGIGTCVTLLAPLLKSRTRNAKLKKKKRRSINK